MRDEGGGLAVLGRNINLAVDHGRCFASLIPGFPWGLNTIARKLGHDKARRPLNRDAAIAIVW
jgi:hypothetical protein